MALLLQSKNIGSFNPTRYVYDQFSQPHFSRQNEAGQAFDPIVEFQFPQPTLAEGELRRASKEVHYRRVFNHPYSMETFSGETPALGPEPIQLGRYKYFYFNQRNDVTSLLKHNGQSLHSYLYDEFGQVYDNNPTSHKATSGRQVADASNFTDPHNHYTFSAKEFDEESELSYFGARYYDSFTGTWMTQDVYRGDYFNPQSLHRYSFVLNNPINRIDLYGFASVEASFSETSGYGFDWSTSFNVSGSTPAFEPPPGFPPLQRGSADLSITPDAKIAEAEADRRMKEARAQQEFDKNLKELERKINVAREKCEDKPGERLQRKCYLAQLGFVPGEQTQKQEYTIKASDEAQKQPEISLPEVPIIALTTVGAQTLAPPFGGFGGGGAAVGETGATTFISAAAFWRLLTLAGVVLSLGGDTCKVCMEEQAKQREESKQKVEAPPISTPATPEPPQCQKSSGSGLLDELANSTPEEAGKILEEKFGSPENIRPGAKTYFDPKTGTSYNLHTDLSHGPPHVDIRQRGKGDITKITLCR